MEPGGGHHFVSVSTNSSVSSTNSYDRMPRENSSPGGRMLVATPIEICVWACQDSVTDSPLHTFIPLIQPHRCACMEKEANSQVWARILFPTSWQRKSTHMEDFRERLCRMPTFLLMEGFRSHVLFRLRKKPWAHFDFHVQVLWREIQSKNDFKKLLPFEILSLKPSEKKTKMFFLKQYFQLQKKE